MNYSLTFECLFHLRVKSAGVLTIKIFRYILFAFKRTMHLSSASPRGGGVGVPRADVGGYGDFMGTLKQISALVVGKCGDLDF